MGSYISKSQEQILTAIQKEYQIQPEPYLLHRSSQQQCLLHKITLASNNQTAGIKQTLEEYARTKCESISRLKAHYHLDNTGYCSEEQHFYLIFEGSNNYNLREELGKRRLMRGGFSEQEIEQIIAAMLCGLREYYHRFQREYQYLSLECMALDQQSKKIYLKDPWLVRQPQASQLSHSLSHYPSPQKLSTYENKMQDYNSFHSHLFTVGAIALELKALQSASSIYIHKREINYGEVGQRLGALRGERLRSGVECLLNPNPGERKKIYQLWGIQNKEIHLLEPIQDNKVGKSQENVSKFQFSTHLNNPFPIKDQSAIFVPQPLQKPVQFSEIPISSNPSLKVGNSVPNYVNFAPYNPPNPIPTSPLINLPAYQPPTLYSPTYPLPQNRQTIINTILDPPKTAIPSFLGQRPPNFSEILARQVKKSSSGDLHKLIKEPQVPIIPKVPEVPIKNINTLTNDLAFHSLASYKESFTYYEPLDKKPQVQQARSESVKTHTDSPSKPQPKEQAIIDLPKEKPVHQQPKEQPSPDTPHRPPSKNKFNSTIVEVRDEDSPQHSAKSEQANEQEYVVEQYQTGSRYEGFKSNGMRNGRGKFYYQDGGYYQGQWKNNKMDGWGKLYYEGGKLAYEGNWSQDEFNGQGKVFNDNPVELTAPFDYRNFEMLEDYWEYYEGMLSHDTKEGRGRIKLSNGELFEGDFHNDRIQGFGKFSCLDGTIVQGIWRESVLIKTINNARN